MRIDMYMQREKGSESDGYIGEFETKKKRGEERPHAAKPAAA